MFDLNFSFYGIAIIIALIANIIFTLLTYKKYKYLFDEMVGLLLYENVGIIFGAKIFTYLINCGGITCNFDFLKTGLSSYGGVIGGLLFIFLFCFQFKKSVKETLYLFAPIIPLMYSIGKIGCYLAGCCNGIKYNGIFKVMYNYSRAAPKGVYLFPIQLVESIVFFIIFLYLIIKIRKNKFDNKTLGLEFILCGISKFTLDFFRMSHTDFLSINQIISIIFIIIGSFVFFKSYRLNTSLQISKNS